MALQFVLNIILAIIWMFLSGSYTFNNFLLGFLIGIGLVYLFKKYCLVVLFKKSL